MAMQELKATDVSCQPKISTEQVEALTAHDPDAANLAHLGKKQVLKRNFGFLSILGFACTIAVTWEGALVTFVTGLTNGGPAGLVYGFIFVWIGSLCLFSTMAELASMAPTSGGQYHWVSMLAPQSCQKFLSYITAWLVISGWQAILAGDAYLCGTMIQALVVLNNPNYGFERWHGTMLFWAVTLVALVINTAVSSLLPKLEGFFLVLHVLGFFAVLIPLVSMAPHGNTSDVFTLFLNGGDFGTQGLSFFVGLIGNVFAIFGCDAAVHMAEEIRNAAIIIPRAMILNVLLNGALGLAMIIAVLFCAGNLDDALNTPTSYPIAEIFTQGVHSIGGGSALVAIILVLCICATIATLTTSSRLVWAFARDRGLPGWRFLSRVDPRTSIPLYAVYLTTIVACLLGIINVGSTAAFNDIISLSVSALFASYIIVEALLLWRRCTGVIRLRSDSFDKITNTTGAIMTWGSFRIPGILGIAVNIFSLVFGTIILFFSFWPTTMHPTAQTMNFSVLITGTMFFFSIVYYYGWARKIYTGPIVELSVSR